MRSLKILLLATFIFVFFAQAAAASKIIDVELIVYQNDTVVEKAVNITEGRYSQIWRFGDYTLEFLDKNRKIVGQQSIDIFFGYSGPVVSGVPKPDDKLFDNYFLSYKHPYNPEIKTVVLRHFDKIIFSKNLDCQDCPSGSKDGYCDRVKDGICDPDCSAEEDIDCKEEFPVSYLIGIGSILLVLAYWRLKKREEAKVKKLLRKIRR